MKILVEKGIPFGADVFQTLGSVILYDGRTAQRLEAPDAECLVTRSNVRVDRELLSNLPALKAVLSPTIGLDHVDSQAVMDFQRKHGRILPVINAPGSTANGVGDYVLAAVLELQKQGILGRECSVGIWGYGNCGHAAADRLRAIGCRVVAYDPPLEHAHKGGFHSAGLDDLLSADCVSLHLPLTMASESRWPTYRIVNKRILDALRGKVLINTSRGAIIDETQAVTYAKQGVLNLVLDVFMAEPTVSIRTVEAAVFATPHVAGSIRQGKLRALEHVYNAWCDLMGMHGKYNFRLAYERLRSPFLIKSLPLTTAGREVVVKAVDIAYLSNRFKQSYKSARSEHTRGFAFITTRRMSMRDEVVWPD